MSYIKINNCKEVNMKAFENNIIVDWNKIDSKEALLKPFFQMFSLNDYIWTYSLDTFEDIFSDSNFLGSKNVKILIINFNNLLTFDEERKKNFYSILCWFLINSDINYEINIIK